MSGGWLRLLDLGPVTVQGRICPRSSQGTQTVRVKVPGVHREGQGLLQGILLKPAPGEQER